MGRKRTAVRQAEAAATALDSQPAAHLLTEEELRRGAIPPGWSRAGWLNRCRYLARIVTNPDRRQLFAEAAAALEAGS